MWTKDEIKKITQSDDLHISPFREDGETYGTPTWIWSVVVDNELYVRAYHGQDSRWYKAAIQQKSGKITIGGILKKVRFEKVNGPIQEAIDKAYQAKYTSSPYLKPMIENKAKAATIKINPV